jgi:hypothetical protein
MPYYKTIVWVFLILAIVSLIVGIVCRAFDFMIIGLAPLTYMRFTGLCLLFVIAVSLVELTSRTKGQS